TEEVRLISTHKALKRSVMLDAGHGGVDGGAVSYHEDGSIKAKEKDFNLDVALRAQKLLEAEGVDVHMIRTEDVYVDFLRVGGIANDAGTSLFVSVHTNSATVPTAHGIETYGYLDAGTVSNGMTSKRLSEILLEELIEETGAHERGVKDGKTLAVINSTKMPATLIEIGFISNEEECEKMMTEEYRQKLAQAICDGILAAFDEMDI
ncbi:MAG: N-acetylmuramoyl-L-alanine amidase, partial [Clostridia bacterium]|nr:N-acetylmuramoyl-L-alanine amidase [Clostridia bacterium]